MTTKADSARERVGKALVSEGFTLDLDERGAVIGGSWLLDPARKITIACVHDNGGAVLQATQFLPDNGPICAMVYGFAPVDKIRLVVQDLAEQMFGSYADAAYRVAWLRGETVREALERVAIEALDDVYPENDDWRPIRVAIDVSDVADFEDRGEDIEKTIRVDCRWMVARHVRTERIELLTIATYKIERN